MLEIKHFSLGQMETNCYLLLQEKDCIIIDPADDAAFILEEIQRRSLRPLALLATHGHFDHVMAAGEIQLSYKIPFYIDQKDQFLVNRMEETANHFLGFVPPIVKPSNVTYLSAGRKKIGALNFEVMVTPGHTPGSVCYFFPDNNVLFSGDTLFKQGIGRYDFSYSDKNDLKLSLRKLLTFPPETSVYPGHGEETTIGNEKNIVDLYSL